MCRVVESQPNRLQDEDNVGKQSLYLLFLISCPFLPDHRLGSFSIFSIGLSLFPTVHKNIGYRHVGNKQVAPKKRVNACLLHARDAYNEQEGAGDRAREP